MLSLPTIEKAPEKLHHLIFLSSCACFEIHDSERVSVDPVILSNVMVMTIMWYLSSYAEKTVF